MLKFIGAALVVASSGAMGALGVKKLRAKVAALDGVLVSLAVMKNEIYTRFLPMQEVLEQLSESAPEPARKLYRNVLAGMSRLENESFSEVWRQAVEKTGELMLEKEAENELSRLGFTLGHYDVYQQAEAISAAMARLEEHRKNAAQKRDRDTKVHAFLSVAAGIFAVIILI